MSKVDAQRAMREANYLRNRANAPAAKAATSAAESPAAPAARTPRAKPVKAAPTTPTEGVPADGRCGHKSMNGRACTREMGHAEKSHRYG